MNDNLLIFEVLLYEEIILEFMFFGMVVLCVYVVDVDLLNFNGEIVFFMINED